MSLTPENSSAGWPSFGEHVNRRRRAISKLDKNLGAKSPGMFGWQCRQTYVQTCQVVQELLSFSLRVHCLACGFSSDGWSQPFLVMPRHFAPKFDFGDLSPIRR
jgi:hypothetical protein